MVLWVGLLTALPALAGGMGTTYGVINTNDSGTGSLRWAIQAANGTAGTDPVGVNFSPGLAGSTIQPLAPLPYLTRDYTVIDGDLDDDGKPDIRIDGGLQSGGSGLVVSGDYCSIIGLCVTAFPKYGVMLSAANYCSIYSCHLGVSRDGLHRLSSTEADVVLWVSDHNQIGGPPATNRNIIGGPSQWVGTYRDAILIANSHYNRIQNNYIALKRSGMSAFPDAGLVGVRLAVVDALTPAGATEAVREAPKTPMTCLGNTIGGSRPALRNVFGYMTTGVELAGAEHNFVLGNYFGLTRDGETDLPEKGGVVITDGSTDNVIGGTTPGARNVFCGGGGGVFVVHAGTNSNRILGNYFGLNAAGTEQRPLEQGIQVDKDAGAQTIGGATAACGNYFATSSSNPEFGVYLASAGDGTLIRNNRFGVRPDGPNASLMDYAISVENVGASIQDNLIARAKTGIDVGGPSGEARVYNNTFRDCNKAVRVTKLATCLLGNLHNTSTSDDGGNTFRTSNVWHIDNRTGSRILAEGNSFDTTVQAEIDAKIYDKLDDATKGRVDFIPLAGGVTPTGSETEPALALSGVTAQPTARGAEVVFTLSAPAALTVQVLNIAGRPVAVVADNSPMQAGLQRLTWTGRTAQGTMAPAGPYLIRVDARNASGQQTIALATLHLAR